MLLLLLWAFALVPDLSKLGADDWHTREAEHERCDNVLSALLLPPFHPDPEVNHRARAIRTKNLKQFDPRYIEACVYRDDFTRWVAQYLVPGRSLLDPVDVFVDIHSDWAKGSIVFEVFPVQGVRTDETEGFLRGQIVPGEYERWVEHQDFHRRTAPRPRPVLPK